MGNETGTQLVFCRDNEAIPRIIHQRVALITGDGAAVAPEWSNPKIDADVNNIWQLLMNSLSAPKHPNKA